MSSHDNPPEAKEKTLGVDVSVIDEVILSQDPEEVACANNLSLLRWHQEAADGGALQEYYFLTHNEERQGVLVVRRAVDNRIVTDVYDLHGGRVHTYSAVDTEHLEAGIGHLASAMIKDMGGEVPSQDNDDGRTYVHLSGIRIEEGSANRFAPEYTISTIDGRAITVPAGKDQEHTLARHLLAVNIGAVMRAAFIDDRKIK